MNSHRPDLGKQPWPISPTFRTGPRRKDHDQNAEEIIRFVRQFQRPDTQHFGASSITRKAVLPAIGGYYSSSDSNSPIYNPHPRLSNLESEVEQSVAEDQTMQTTLEDLNNNSVQRFERIFSSTGSVNRSSSSSLHDAYNNNNVDLLCTMESQESMKNSNISRTHEHLHDFTENKSVIPDDQRPTSRSTNPGNTYDKLKLISTPTSSTTPPFSMHSSKWVTYKYCPESPQNIGELSRSRALPQLPPIATCAVSTRPSAPSPSPISPSPMPIGETDDFSDDDDNDKDAWESPM